MKPARFLGRLLPVVLLVVFIGSCGTDVAPTGVALSDTSRAPDVHLGDLLEPLGLLSCDPLPEATTVKTIGPRGGIIHVGPHRLIVPRYALSHRVTITAYAPSDTVNAVQFEPHGLRFRRSAYLQMSYANCNTLGLLVPKRIAYTTDLFDLIEFLVSWDNLLTQRVTGRLDHFSQYAVAW